MAESSFQCLQMEDSWFWSLEKEVEINQKEKATTVYKLLVSRGKSKDDTRTSIKNVFVF